MQTSLSISASNRWSTASSSARTTFFTINMTMNGSSPDAVNGSLSLAELGETDKALDA